MKDLLKILIVTIIAITPLTACEDNDTPAEKFEDATDDMGDAVEDFGDAVEDAVE